MLYILYNQAVQFVLSNDALLIILPLSLENDRSPLQLVY